MKLLLTIAFTTIWMLPQMLNAQGILDRLNKKMQQKVEERIENKVDEKIDKEIDKIEKEQPDKKERESAIERLSKISVTSEPVKYEQTYIFNESMVMEMSIFNKKNELKNASKFTILFTPSEANFGYSIADNSKKKKKDESKSLFVYDKKNDAMLMLNETEDGKNGIATSIKIKESKGEEQTESESDDFKFTKTGRTKIILGYKCDEWAGESQTSKAIYWVTKDINWHSSNFINNTAQKKSNTFTRYPEGMMLEADITSEDNERVHYLVTEINHNINFRLNTADYQISNLGSVSF